jgi:hypothetical protein
MDTTIKHDIYIKVLFIKKSNLQANGYTGYYSVFINNALVYSTGNLASWNKADLRIFLINFSNVKFEFYKLMKT